MTPGKWSLALDDGSQVAVVSDCKEHPLICTVSKGEGRPYGDSNAAAIVALPALLEACKAVIADCELSKPDGHVLQRATVGKVNAAIRAAAEPR